MPPSSATTDPGAADAGAAPTTRVARSRPCFGDPPRQIDDPMSPACLAAIFEGDNGGVTARGVTGTEIRVGVPIVSTGAVSTAAFDALFEHMNRHFEFYGRRLVPVYLPGTASDPLAARAMVAEFVGKDIFASLIGVAEVVNAHAALPIEFARQGVVTIARAAAMGWSDRTVYDPWHPYLWSVFPSTEDVQANLADLACSSLVGRPARFAGDAGLRTATRKFGIVAASQVTPPQVSVLAQALESCTGEAPLRATITSASPGQTAFESLKARGATTLFCICEDDYSYSIFGTAHAAGFHPEWVLSDVTYAGCEFDCWAQQSRRSGALAPPMMLSAQARGLPVQARPWFAPVAPLLAAPGADFYTTSRVELVYASLLALASGVQGAGPTLTPDTFGQALMATQFPNPGAGQAPYWQPGAGFGPGDHSFYDDYSIGWWSDDADAFEQAQTAAAKGSWCYVDRAARFRPGGYPADLEGKLFNRDLPCR